jgi:hypothetical protein
MKNATPKNLENCRLRFFENIQNRRIGIINSSYFTDLTESMIFIKEPVKTGSSLGSSLIFQNVESQSYYNWWVLFRVCAYNRREAISCF